MSPNFCEKTFHTYIETLSYEMVGSFYLSESLLITSLSGSIYLRIEAGEWQHLTSQNICFIPKGTTIEIKKIESESPTQLNIIPLSSELLSGFYQQYHAICNPKKKPKEAHSLCAANFEKVPIIQDIFNSAYLEVTELNHNNVATHDIVKKNKISIYLNFILAFFLNVDTFVPALNASLQVSVKERVYHLIFNSTGKHNSSLESIAKQLHMSAATLKRRLVSEGTSFSKISLMSRMNKAMMLSKTNNMPMTRIAQEVGYDDIPFFMSTFKNYYRTQSPAFL